jgi:predicted RNA binding protein YcfA (HicA-like mRNA interferase family)
VKRIDLIKQLEAQGCELVRHGGKHDWYRNPRTGVAQPVPRHREIKEALARRILKMLSDSADPTAGEPSA